MVPMKEKQKQQNMIHLGTHGEDYGNWMSNPVLYTIGGLLVVTGAVASLASTVFHVTVLSGLALIAAISLLLLLCWCGWIRRQYAFGGGGIYAHRKSSWRNTVRTGRNDTHAHNRPAEIHRNCGYHRNARHNGEIKIQIRN